jgi:hypothetical protein
MEKEYGKLSLDQFKRLLSFLPEILDQQTEIQKAFRSASSAKLEEVIGEGLYWAHIYELSLVEHLALVAQALGIGEFIVAAAASSDPQEVVIADLERDESDQVTANAESTMYTKSDVVSLVLSVQYTIKSITVYGRSLSVLIAEVKGGNDDSLFKAIRVDRTAIANPTIAGRIARAELMGEKRFFDRLRSALKGLSKKHWAGREKLRYTMAALRELGPDQLSDDELERLLVKELKVYPNQPTARKNLRKQYYESKKLKNL